MRRRHLALPGLRLLLVSQWVRRTQLSEQLREHLLSQPVKVKVQVLQLELRGQRQANLFSLQVLLTKDFGTPPPS